MRKARTILWLALVAAGCGGTQRVKIKVLHPAAVNLSAYKQIVLGDLGGKLAPRFSAGMKETLVDGGHFKVLDRSQLRQILGELKLSQSDLADPKKRVKIGRLLSGSVILTGHMDGEYREQNTARDSKCYRKTGKDEKGKSVYGNVPCKEYSRQGKAATRGNVDIVDVETGSILKTKTLKGTCEKKTQATDDDPLPIDGDELLDCALNENVTLIARTITPWSEDVQAPFERDKAVPTLALGIRHAETGEFGEAAKVFADAAKASETSAKIPAKTIAKTYWNLALAQKYMNDHRAALRSLQKAYTLDPRRQYLDEQASVKAMRSEHEELKRQGAVQSE